MRSTPPLALLATVLLAATALAGCASIDAARKISAAEVALEAARAAGGERAAPYEFVTAEVTYQKALEENAVARYGDAVDHAVRARQYAEEAQRRAADAPSRAVRK